MIRDAYKALKIRSIPEANVLCLSYGKKNPLALNFSKDGLLINQFSIVSPTEKQTWRSKRKLLTGKEVLNEVHLELT